MRRSRRPIVLRPATGGGSSRSLLTIDDLQWQGISGRTPDGDSVGSPGGSSSLSSGAIAVRYVSGQRRLLIPNFIFGPDGELWGDLVEYRESGTLYTGSDPTLAPELIETRRWPKPDWTTLFTDTPTWANSSNHDNTARLGTIYWDESRGVLWYSIYGYYSSINQPILAAVQLLDSADTGRGGTYCEVGDSYGPWWYRADNVTGEFETYWKQMNYFMFPIPTSAQADLGGRKVMFGGATGATTGASGYIGPGMNAHDDWPDLGDPPNSVMSQGLVVADYSFEAGVTPGAARRTDNYTPLDYSDHQLSVDLPDGGYWAGSLDRVVGMTWIETPTKHGVLLYGVQVSGRMSYGDNPISTTAQELASLTHSGTTATGTVAPYPHVLEVGTSITITGASPSEYNGTFTVTAVPTDKTFQYTMASDPGSSATRANADIPIYLYGWDTNIEPDLLDLSRPNPEAQHGYLGEYFTAQTFVFDPQHIREVGLGSRAANNTGINPIELGNWHTQWPNLPWDKAVAINASQSRWVADQVANRLFWDNVAQELIWVAGQSVSASNLRPTVNIFTIAA